MSHCQRHLSENSLCHLTGLWLFFFFISCTSIFFYFIPSKPHIIINRANALHRYFHYIDKSNSFILCVAATILNFLGFQFAYIFCTFLGKSAALRSKANWRRRKNKTKTNNIREGSNREWDSVERARVRRCSCLAHN